VNEFGLLTIVYTVSKKKSKPKCFCHLQNSADSDASSHVVFWINLLQSTVNVFHLIWIVSLHYLVKL